MSVDCENNVVWPSEKQLIHVHLRRHVVVCTHFFPVSQLQSSFFDRALIHTHPYVQIDGLALTAAFEEVAASMSHRMI